MKKMTAMPINGKKLKNLFLQAQWADCLETWFANHHFGFVILRLQKIVSSYPKQISHCSLSVHGSDKTEWSSCSNLFSIVTFVKLTPQFSFNNFKILEFLSIDFFTVKHLC